MKKLMIAAAVAMLGIAANAAKCDWDAVNISAYTTGSSYSIWAFDTASYAVQTAKDDFADGNLDFSKGSIGEIELPDAVGDRTGYDNGGTVNMYLVVFNNETASDATAAYFSGVETTTIPGTGIGAAVSFDLAGSSTPDNWTTAGGPGPTPVPEPTSGLMLLLGMGALALRRRRA